MTTVLWPSWTGKRVLLGITGGIAAYKSAELCRLLVRCGAEVTVMMTAAARRFVGETTFAALSNRAVHLDLFAASDQSAIGHIALADQADLLVVAPCTANFMAKLAHGLADDLPSTVCLAFGGPVLLAPAMNVQMWSHPATRDNVALLLKRGYHFAGPGAGEMACGHVGAGRMIEPEELLQAIAGCLAPQDLEGRAVLITAGPTHEPLDPVRFLGNRSSGKMGFALAAEAVSRGARVTLISGPTRLPTPYGVQRQEVVTAQQMAAAVHQCAAQQDVVIMAAAVADYRPPVQAETKIKKVQTGAQWSITLERNEDILAQLGALNKKTRPYLVGFAAETGSELEQLGQEKRAAKGCDLLVVNNVLAPDAGFEVETNEVMIVDAQGGIEPLPLQSKRQVASAILSRVARALGPRRAGQS